MEETDETVVQLRTTNSEGMFKSRGFFVNGQIKDAIFSAKTALYFLCLRND